MPDRVCLGAITGAHGVNGTVRITSFTTVPEDVAVYGPVGDEAGKREFGLEVIGMSSGAVLARIEGVDDRDAAEALKGTRLYVARDALPPAGEEEYYHGDLLGLPVERADGAAVGTVIAVHTVGAADALEIDRGPGRDTAVVPFTRAAVPMVDIAGRRIVIDPPPGLLDDEDDGGDGAGGAG